MSVAFLADTLKIPNLATLKAIAASERRDGMLKIVDLIASTTPAYNLSNILYRYDASSSLTALEPAIIEPDDSSGRYIMQPPLIHFGTAAPVDPPPLPDMTWVAFLTSPDRKVIWRSKVDLSDTPVLDDWLPSSVPSSITGVPSFSADFVGQKVIDTNTNYVYKAINTTGDWILSIQDNGFVTGAAITGDETLTLSSHGQMRSLTANAIVTLPAGLTTNIELRLVVFDAIAGGAVTLTLRPDTGTTINGGTIDINANNTIAQVFNIGSDWFVK